MKRLEPGDQVVLYRCDNCGWWTNRPSAFGCVSCLAKEPARAVVLEVAEWRAVDR